MATWAASISTTSVQLLLPEPHRTAFVRRGLSVRTDSSEKGSVNISTCKTAHGENGGWQSTANLCETKREERTGGRTRGGGGKTDTGKERGEKRRDKREKGTREKEATHTNKLTVLQWSLERTSNVSIVQTIPSKRRCAWGCVCSGG